MIIIIVWLDTIVWDDIEISLDAEFRRKRKEIIMVKFNWLLVI